MQRSFVGPPTTIGLPTLAPECNDTERRSLLKINSLENQISATLAQLARPGGAEIALANYLFGLTYQIPAGADLLDVSVYNPNDTDQWVYLMITPNGPQPGMAPTFPIRVYGHNHAYYEAYASATSVASGYRWDIAVSSTENQLTWGLKVYLAIRHS